MTHLLVYQTLFGISIVTNVGIALACVFVPDRFAGLVGLKWQEPMRGYARAWGATLIGLHLVYVPGLLYPIGEQWINWSSIAIKFGMPTIFWSNPRGFKMFGLWDFSWGLVLLVAYSIAIW
jgi:hypothetical protein